MSELASELAIVVLSESSVAIARQIQEIEPDAIVYGLVDRTQSADQTYGKLGDFVRDLYQQGRPIVGICAAGILIRTLAPLLSDKRAEPPVLAIAEDGSAVVPLLGGLNGANQWARRIAAVLQVSPAITTTGDRRFRVNLLSPPTGYRLVNSDEEAKTFVADLLAGATVKIIGNAPWLKQSEISFTPDGTHTIEITNRPILGDSKHLIYQFIPESTGNLSIIGTGPGSANWMSPEVKTVLQSATDWVGYKTYLDLAEPFRLAHITRHESDNRVELDRARAALNLAAQGRSVVVVSSGDPGIYAMAAAVFEVLDREADPAWSQIELRVCPGISAMQAAAAQVGAPLGHDFCVISLSDILKPWDVIAQRLLAAAQADFAIALYNPVSTQRTEQFQAAKDILLTVRSHRTPVVLARNLGRSGQRVIVKRLGEVAIADADMRTVILIGSSQTRTIPKPDGSCWVYTPRFYEQ